MSKEYEYWRKESLQCMSKLDEQQRITEEIAQPLRRYDVDIGIDQRKQKRPLKRHQHDKGDIPDEDQITHRPVVQVDELAALPGPLAPGGEDLAEGGEGAGQRGLRGIVERYVGHGTSLERVEF